ncbi:MAG: GNAT family N-acetyltransferase [Anaerolineales bacterium]
MTQSIIQTLDNGLLLRHATPADADALAAFNARIHSDAGPDMPDDRVGVWVHDLLARPHPTFQPGDFTVVEDIRTGQIVSSLNTISQTWSYAGLPFKVGRPELVGTHPDYRNRGLVRKQFDMVHRWSAERGEMVQAITGIPWYYRQFGYEMTVNLGGARLGYEMHVPKLKESEAEPFTIRPATEADLAFIAQVSDAGHRRDLLACVRDEALWRYELNGKNARNLTARVLCVIESTGGVAVGLLAHPSFLWSDQLMATEYELSAGVSWLAVTPSIIRYLWATGQAYAEAEKKKCVAFGLGLGEAHPAYRVMHDRTPREWKPYAWYLRVPDVACFLRHIAPVLEQRLAESIAAGHTGELKISFYRSGVLIKFDAGRLTFEPWQPQLGTGGDASFPDLTFLHLLFGHRTFDELRHFYTDCGVESDEARVLLEVLFPKQLSNIWPVS